MFPTTRPALSWDQALLSFSRVNRFPSGKANRKVSYLVRYLCIWITRTWLSHHLHVLSRDYCDIRRTLNSTPGSSRPYTMHISRHNTGIPRMWTVLGKTSYIRLIGYRWPRIICRLLLTHPITQWSIFMVSTDLFQAFRWAENGASGEQRKITSERESKKKANMSIAQWRPYFHCQGILPTQLVDPQLIMYFFFIFRLRNNFFW